MSRYGNVIFMVQYLFAHYVIIAGPAAIISLLTGAAITIIELLAFRFNFAKGRERMFLIASWLPLFIGIAGTVIVINTINTALSLEEQVGRAASANKYYDLQYGYDKPLLIIFPLIIGIMSSIPPLVTWRIAIRKGADRR
jgi:hypothetical protein